MRQSVFRRKRTVAGKRSTSNSYYGRYRIDGQPTEKTVCLNTSDKQAAEARLRRIVAEEERAREGIGISPDVRESMRRHLSLHLMDFVVDRERIGRAPDYVRQLKGKLERLMKECGWQKIGDIAPDSFVKWRQKQTPLSAKTLNEYLIAAKSFCSWLKKQRRGLSDNPLEDIDGMSTVGQERFERRALSGEEIRALLATSGPRRPLYAVAIYTGLRRGELKQLAWSDLRLEGEKPAIHARAATTKNRKTARLNLHPRALRELVALRQKAASTTPDSLVFAGMMPTANEFRADLAAAGIKHTREKRVDFHSLRHTLSTQMTLHGVSPRVAMEAMRHSDIRLTMKTYTDADLLPTAEAIARLPDFGTDEHTPRDVDSAGHGAHIGARILGAVMHALSPFVTHSQDAACAKTAEGQAIRSTDTLKTLQRQPTEETCAMQGSNVSAGAEDQGVAKAGARVASLEVAEAPTQPQRLSPPLPPSHSGKGGESPAICDVEKISAEAGDDGQLRPCQLSWREPQPSENTRRRQTSERGNDLEELCEVARCWPELAPAVRNAILVIVRAHAGEGDRGAAAARAASGASAPVTLSINRNKIPNGGREFR